MLVRSCSCALLALVLGCGGSSTQARSPASTAPALSQTPAGPAAAPPEKEKKTVDVEQAKMEFGEACLEQTKSAIDYCACTWKETRKLGSPAEIETGMVDQEKLAAQIETVCMKLLRPEDDTKAPGKR